MIVAERAPTSPQSPTLDTVTIVIPAYNASSTLADCLDAVVSQRISGWQLELLVVDDGSNDATRALASRPGVRVLSGAGRGPAAARNLGARTASGDTLVFLDADTQPEPDWLEELLAPFQDPDVVAVKGAYSTNQGRLLPRFVQLEFEYKYARLARAKRVDFLDTGTVALRRAHFLAAGGFDERFPANSAEDVDLAFRLAEQGARFVFEPNARVRHQHPERLREYLQKKLRYGYFRVDIYRHHPKKALGDSYTPPGMALQIGLAGVAALLVPAALKKQRARKCLLAVLLAFLASTWPLAQRAARSDPGLSLSVPPLVFARAFAQGLGIAAGLTAMALRGDTARRRP